MIKVLLVDDEAPILNNLNKVIPWKDMGMEVVGLARSGMDALEIAKEHDPDLVLSDIRMPLMDGLTFITKLRENGSTAEIFLLTGYQEFEYAREAIKLRVKDYISKPIHYFELEERIREIGEEIRKKQLKEKYLKTVSLIESEPDPDTVKKTPEQLMTSALDYINTNLGADLGIEELSDYLGISSSYFCLLFKNHVGFTFVEYLTKQRMEAAKFLLTNSDKNIAQIGAFVGYHERRYFTKVFQKSTGMTPSEFREVCGSTSVI
ncbi:response regulator transcription factor [Paenibacillus faecalis]|uniref:response regulator transcription factor n=1 Tax=Paenibacillus faecalis TaxID=2079532 RepID=UPI000D110217|nr:response regulator [Paenibacillus faecalis]